VKPILHDKPRQDNDDDCGPFVMGIVRWAYEGWSLDNLTPDVLTNFRHRVLLELENWSLSNY